MNSKPISVLAKGCFIFLLVLLLQACTGASSSTSSHPRTLMLSSDSITESERVSFATWKCRNFVFGRKVIFEVGIFKNNEQSRLGFVLFDGTNTGELTNYSRQGDYRQWTWKQNGRSYSVVMEPDNSLLYYDFTNVQDGDTKQAQEVYKCKPAN